MAAKHVSYSVGKFQMTYNFITNLLEPSPFGMIY